MLGADHLAHHGPLSRVALGPKLLVGGGALILSWGVQDWSAHLALAALLALLTLVWARVPLRTYLGWAAVPLAFLVPATLGAALTSLPPGAEVVWAMPVGPWRIGLSTESLALGLSLLGRGLAGTAALSFLALTVPLTQWMDLLRRAHAPAELQELVLMMYRFAAIFASELRALEEASQLKFAGRSMKTRLGGAAAVGGVLFLRVMGTQRDWQHALDARFQGLAGSAPSGPGATAAPVPGAAE